jgi:TetR/AcrR family transcriptional regulator
MGTRKVRSADKPPTLRKRLKAEERRSQLLKIARGLFSEHGFENTTTKAIAAAAGVTEAIIFRHFASKEELYASILDYKAAEIDIEAWGDELNNFSKSENDEALVLSVVKHILEADRRDPQFQRLMLQAALSRHPLSKITAQRLLPLQRFLGNYIRKRQRKGAFQQCDPKLAACAIIGMPSYLGLAKVLFGVDGLKLSEDRKALGFTRIILEGLNAPGDPSHKKERSKNMGFD